MKRVTLIIFMIMISWSICAQVAVPPSVGDGSVNNPYQIATLENLYWISSNTANWANHYLQIADIEASSTVSWFQHIGWSPIGYYGDGGDPLNFPFTGSYNGQGHFINGLGVSFPYLHGGGLFGYISGATISNLGVTNIQIMSGNLDSYNIGGLAGFVENNSIINNCFSSGAVYGHEQVGGLVGYSINSTIVNSHSSCTTVGETHVGGLIGGAGSNSVLKNCYSTGEVTASLYFAGGFVGVTGYFVNISNSYSTGNVVGCDQVGGFAGTQMLSTILNCYSRGNVTNSSSGGEEFGGFIGHNQGDFMNFYPPAPSHIKNCYSTGSVFYQVGETPTNKGFTGFDYYSENSSNFFDSDISNQDTDETGIGSPQTTMVMTIQALNLNNIYVNNGWDFKGEPSNGTEEIWNIGNGRNDGYPYLSWQYPDDNATLPVTLSSFTATCSASNVVSLAWTTQSESNLLGYYIYRNNINLLESANRVTNKILNATNQTNEQHYSFSDAEVEINNTYYYWLQSIEANGSIQYYGPVTVQTTQGIVTPPIINSTLIENVYPNPIKQEHLANFRIKVKDSETADLKIYNIKGQIVKQYSILNSGNHTIQWDGKDTNNKQSVSGIYFYQLSSPSYNITKKLLIIK